VSIKVRSYTMKCTIRCIKNLLILVIVNRVLVMKYTEEMNHFTGSAV